MSKEAILQTTGSNREQGFPSTSGLGFEGWGNLFKTDKLCWGAFGWHICFTDEDDTSYMGINIPGMVEDEDDFEIQTFPCDYCNYTSESMNNVKQHFQLKHKGMYRIKCWECEKEVKSMTEFKQHIGTYHYEERFVGQPGPKSQV